MRKTAFLLTVAFSMFFLFGLLFAQLGGLPAALSELCIALTNLLPVVGMLMVLIAAVVYALGQIMGMETRARANVWATAALGGALMAFLIVTIAQPVLSAVFEGDVSCASGGGAGGGNNCGTENCVGSQICCGGFTCCNAGEFCRLAEPPRCEIILP